jgi:hypothetical protein
MKTKDIHIDPNDDSTTILARATECCNGSHQTIAGALLKSPQWKAWYDYASRKQLFDVDESMMIDCMSDAHWKTFVLFIRKMK